MRKFLLAFGACLALMNTVNAQNERCGTDLMDNRAKARNPFLIEAQRNFRNMITQEMVELRENRDGEMDAVLVIPVVFHVLHMYGIENISDAQIHDQMTVLNRDYNKLNADTIVIVDGFDTIAANVRLEFRLATKDPEGFCTNGIQRIPTIETFVGDNGSKLQQWPRERYLNVWTVATMENGVAGYSQYPSSVIDELSARADGVIIRHNYIGRIGTGSEYNSRALTHEVGHWLDLMHPWGSTNDPGVECGDDSVTDTPDTEGADLVCNLKDFSCSQTVMQDMAYHFDDVAADAGGNLDPTTPPAALLEDENFARVTFSAPKAMGVSANPVGAEAFEFSQWGIGAPNGVDTTTDLTGSIDLTKYYEFTLTPRAGSAMNINQITFKVKRDSLGCRTFAVRSSLTNFGGNLTPTVAPASDELETVTNGNYFFFSNDTSLWVNGSKITLGGTLYQSIQTPVTFRIYGWNAESADGSFAIDDLEIGGTYGKVENVQNYMDYSYCSVMFTEGQKERMRTALASGISGRSNLYTDANRAITGTDDNPLTCAPEADFYPEERFLCIGDETTFRDLSTNGEVDSWYWTFEDGNPSTSTEQNPDVSFNTYGRKTVTLTVTNAQGSTTKTVEQSVIVAPSWTEFPGALIQEGFDSYDEFYNRWIGVNLDNNMSSWQQTNTTGASNNTSVKLNAFDMDVTFIDEGGRDIDQLISPSMDLSVVDDNAEVTFKWAFATQSTALEGIVDQLDVYISNDCGRTWSSQPRISISGTDLVTAGQVATSFVPDQPEYWEQASFTVPSSYYNDGFRMMFMFRAGDFPNNLYIDDINLNAALAVNEENTDFYGARVYPNPANEDATLSYYTQGNTDLNITLTDMSGRVVMSWTPNVAAPGKQNLTIPVSALAKGVYTVNLQSAKNISTLKLMVK